MTNEFKQIIETFKGANLYVLKIMNYSKDSYLVSCNETGSLFTVGPAKFFVVSKDLKQTKVLGTLLPNELSKITQGRELDILYTRGDE